MIELLYHQPRMDHFGAYLRMIIPAIIRPTHDQIYNFLHMLLTKKGNLHTWPARHFLNKFTNSTKSSLLKLLNGHLEEQVRNIFNHCQWLKETLICIGWNEKCKKISPPVWHASPIWITWITWDNSTNSTNRVEATRR